MNDSQRRPLEIIAGSPAASACSEVTVDPLYSSRRDVILVHVVKLVECDRFEGYYASFKRDAAGLFKDLISSLRQDGGTYEQLSIANAMDSIRCRLTTLLESMLGAREASAFQSAYTQAARNDQRAAFSRPDDKIAYPSHVLSIPPELYPSEQERLQDNMRSFTVYANFKETLALEDHSAQGRLQPEYRKDQHLYDVVWTLMCHGVEISQNPRIFDEHWKLLPFMCTIGEVQGNKLYGLLDRPKGLTFGSQVYGSIYRVSSSQASSFVLKRPLGGLLYVHNTPNNVLAYYGGVTISGPVSYVLQRVLDDDSDTWAVESNDMSYVIPGDSRRRPTEPARRSIPSSLSSSLSSSTSPPPLTRLKPTIRELWRARHTLVHPFSRESSGPIAAKTTPPRSPSSLIRHEPLRATGSPLKFSPKYTHGGARPPYDKPGRGEHHHETLILKKALLRPHNRQSLISASKPNSTDASEAPPNELGTSAQIVAALPQFETQVAIGLSTSLPASTTSMQQVHGSLDKDSPVQGPSATSSFGSIINCYSRASSSGSSSPHILSSTAVHTEVTQSEGTGTTVINNINQKFYIQRGDTFLGTISGGFVGGRRNLNTVSEVPNA